MIDFMTVLYTRWRFDNYTQFHLPDFFSLKKIVKLCLHFSYTGHNYFHFDEFCYLTATENEATEKMEMESENVVQDTEVMEIDTKIVEKSPEKPAQVVAKKEVKIPVVKELDEKQKYALKSAYKFPSDSCILVHPHPKAKSGKFDCTVMSLSVLLDYR